MKELQQFFEKLVLLLDAIFTSPAALSLLSIVVMPLVIIWYRSKRSFDRIGEGLSADEARFRVDIIERAAGLEKRCDALMAANVECERRALVQEGVVAQQALEIEELRRHIERLGPPT